MLLGFMVATSMSMSAARAQATGEPATAPAPLPGAAQVEDAPASGRFGALWLTPVATHWFQGAGLEAGYRHRWVAGLYRAGFFQNGYEPVADGPFVALARTRRFLLDLELDGQWTFAGRVALALGAGVGLLADDVAITAMNGQTWTTVTDHRFRARPLVGATLAGPLFQVGVVTYVGADPELRLSIGVHWGRVARR